MLTTAMLPLWVGFLVLILALLAVDLGVSHKSPKVPSPKEALWWSAFWISLGLLFNVAIYFIYEGGWVPEGGPEQLTGRRASLFFLTGYLVEKLLSLDNLFVMAAILSAFRIPGAAQHRVLFWGILGALVLRGLMIFAGTAAVQRFSWLVYPLALLLVVTGGKLLRSGVSSEDGPATDGLLVRLVKRVIPVRDEPTGLHFFIKVGGRWAATPAFLALMTVETSDVLFALDSVPAVLAITLDPFIVFTSNVFAILGLRALYFVLASLIGRFVYLKHTLSVLLMFIGLKLALTHHVPISPVLSLLVVAAGVGIGITASVLAERRGDTDRPRG